MGRRLYFFVFYFEITGFLSAQTTVHLRGKVVDLKTGEPLA
jgi:hypothetical protein